MPDLTETYEWPNRGIVLKACGLIPVWEYQNERVWFFLKRDPFREEDPWTAVFNHRPSGLAFRNDASTPDKAMLAVEVQILELLRDLGEK